MIKKNVFTKLVEAYPMKWYELIWFKFLMIVIPWDFYFFQINETYKQVIFEFELDL